MNDQKSDAALTRSLLSTVAFFDLADFPLALFEVYKWLWQPDRHYTLIEVDRALHDAVVTKTLARVDGFYCLPGRERIVQTRLARYQIAEKKFNVALRAARVLRVVPFVRCIAVCNTVGYSNARTASDIDFFIIGRRGRLWLVRLLVTALASLVGYRRHGRKITDRVCLSFYVADDALDLSTIALTPFDPYLVYWHLTLTPVYARSDTYDQFCRANQWVYNFLPQATPVRANYRRTIADYGISTAMRSVGEWLLSGIFGVWCERFSQMLQMVKIHYHPAPAVRGERSVIVNSAMLKFHEVDRRAAFRAGWETKRHELGLV